MTSWSDAVNGALELCGALMLAMNIVAVRRDKQIKGIHWAPTVFFTVWGLWNIYFYPSLNQWLSFVGAVCMVAANAIWLLHVWWYWRKAPAQSRDWLTEGAEFFASIDNGAADVIGSARNKLPGIIPPTHAPVPQEGAGGLLGTNGPIAEDRLPKPAGG